MSTEQKLAALETYFDLMRMNGAARIYSAARELGIYEAIGGGASTAGEIAASCGLEERPVSLLLDGLCAIETVSCDDGIYTLAPVAALLSGNYKNLGDEYWRYLPHFLKTGVPLAKMDTVEHSEEQYQKQVTELAWMMRPAAEAMAQMLGIGQSRAGLSILDVGAGSAIWSLSCARHDPQSRVTAVDWPGVLQIAAGFAVEFELQDRFTMLPGNYHEVDLGTDVYDLAIVANVTHIETMEGNRDLFGRLHRALKTGGEIAVIDVMPGQSGAQLSCALYALGLGLRTEQGQVHAREALETFLTDAGFSGSTFHPIALPPYTMAMILAKKES